MSASGTQISASQNPFVGLRSFEPADAPLFHGRKEHTQQLLRLLAEHRFVGVVGTSGSGKSSLVKAGLLPALYRGYLRGATSRWKMAVMRPGDAPMLRLAEALCARDSTALPGKPEDIAGKLEENSGALVELVRGKLVEGRQNLLLVVDQFEELFHQRGKAATSPRDAAWFVAMLLRTREELEVPIFTVLTMRSEYLGDCARYPGLAEALSDAQYLIPRLTRDQREEAIRGPLLTAGADIEDALVERLLNDAGDDPDQLPALQHALMRLYAEAPGLTLQAYVDAPGLRVGTSLDTHAQGIYNDALTESQRALAEKVFRCLTNTEEGREVRRPTKLKDIYAVVGADGVGANGEEARGDVRAVVRTFAENSLLFSSTGGRLEEDTRIDITHESLIRQWKLLKEWVRQEAESADWFARLARSAELHGENKADTWGRTDVEFVDARIRREGWNAAWGGQYRRSGFEGAIAFLGKSRQAILDADAEKQRQADALAAAQARELKAARELAATRERELATAAELAAVRERELASAHALAAAQDREMQNAVALAEARERELVAARDLTAARERELEVARSGRNRLLVALAGLTLASAGLVYFAWMFSQERKHSDELRRNAGGFTNE